MSTKKTFFVRGRRSGGGFGHGNAPKRAQMKEMLQPEHKKAPKRAQVTIQTHFRARKRHFSCAEDGAQADSGTERPLDVLR